MSLARSEAGQSGSFQDKQLSLSLWERGLGEGESIPSAQIQPDHILPVGPVVRPAVPDAQRVPDVLLPQDLRKILGGPAQRLGLAGGQDDVHAPHLLQPPRVVLVFDELHRVVEVDVVVVVPVGPVADVVQAVHGQHAAYQIGVAKGEVDRLIRAEAGPQHHQEGVGVALGEGDHLAAQVVVVLRLAPGAVARPFPARVPAFGVHAVHAVELDIAALDGIGHGVDHALVLPVEVAPLRGGKDDDARAAVAVHHQLHVAAQVGAVPALMFSVHGVHLFCARRCSGRSLRSTADGADRARHGGEV